MRSGACAATKQTSPATPRSRGRGSSDRLDPRPMRRGFARSRIPQPRFQPTGIRHGGVDGLPDQSTRPARDAHHASETDTEPNRQPAERQAHSATIPLRDTTTTAGSGDDVEASRCPAGFAGLARFGLSRIVVKVTVLVAFDRGGLVGLSSAEQTRGGGWRNHHDMRPYCQLGRRWFVPWETGRAVSSHAEHTK